MKPADAFGVAVRVIGLLVVLGGAGLILPAFLSLVLGGPGEVVGLLFYGLPAVLVGLALLRWTGPIVGFSFPEAAREHHEPSGNEPMD